MTDRTPNPFQVMFEDPQRVSTYADGPPRFTPGFYDMHRMVGVLIRERTKDEASVLVHGCGVGLEIESMAHENRGWAFLGVDPAKPMLAQAAIRLEAFEDRVELHHGYIETAPLRQFDAATSLLTLHFLDQQARIEALSEMVKRLKSGAPLIVVHTSFPSGGSVRDVWLSRYEAYAVASGVEPEIARTARQAVAASSTMFDPEKDFQLLSEAGLLDVTHFYSAFTWQGWVGYAP